MSKYVYVGVSARSRTAGPLNGLYRRPADSDKWELCSLPENTEVYQVVTHPTEKGVVLAACNSGLWRSPDRGNSWTCLQPTEKGEVMFSILFHPTNPKMIFVGTGPVGLLRSEDDGKTWRRMPPVTVKDQYPGAMLCRIMRMAIQPSEPNTLYAGMEVNGMMRSDDLGETWIDLNDPLLKLGRQPGYESMIITKDPAEGMLDVHSISTSTAAPGAVFVACRMGIFRGDDHGQKWTDLGIGRYSDGKVRYGREVMPSPFSAKVMFACVGDHARGEHGRLYRSEDGGANWKQLDSGVTVRTPMVGVVQDPEDAGSIHAVGRVQSFSSFDGGKSWKDIPLPKEAGSAVTVALG